MKKEKYSFIKRSDNNYEFISEGPNGSIIKRVEFFRLPMAKSEMFLLGFGDQGKTSFEFDDMSVSNNLDTEKILMTVAWAVNDFMKDHANAVVMASGSTPSRTRLYQMKISKSLSEINESFEVKGWVNETWQPFQKGINYTGFLIKRKYYSNN